MNHAQLLPVATAMAILALTSTPARAASMSAGPSAPIVDGDDVANFGAATGADKWWPGSTTTYGNPGKTVGQTFRTGSGAVLLKAVTFRIRDASAPTKTYTIRVGTISGTTFTEVYSESATQGFATAADDYWTWTFDSPVLLSPDTDYGVDVGLNSSTSSWETGIPYVHYMSTDAFADGTRFRSGTAGDGVGDTSVTQDSGERIFHLDLGPPLSAGFDFVAGNPPDDAVDALAPVELAATFSQNLVAGTGNITIRNLTDSIDTVIPVGDARVSISDNLLIIAPASPLLWSKDYAIRIDPGAIENESGAGFAGITDDATWNFTTAAGDLLLDAIAKLKDHITGAITLSGAQIEAHKLTIDLEKGRLDESAPTITAVFDLVETYDRVVGPLWLAGSPVQSFTRSSVSDQDINWVVYQVMQDIMDEVYNANTIAGHEALLDGYKFGSSAHFPGAVDRPANPSITHTATINGSFPETFGRDTQQWTLPARKPTGTYLAPGTIATVTVPPALVGRGYQVRIGAHSWDLSGRPPVKRLERATILYGLDAPTIKVASPYGGGIYIEVPMGADAGVVDVDITGAVRSPYFSAKSFDATTLSDWTTTERNHPAPWADFQTEKFMMQVPTSWIYALPDPVTLMANWDLAMDAINDLMGFPHLRGKETMYVQPDLILRSSVHAPGYPAVNVTYNPNSTYNGNHDNYLVQGPRSGASTEFHEQGHAYFFPKFGGETEANVNLLYVAVRNRVFGASFDDAHRTSVNYGNFGNVTTDAIDNTAVLWMTSFNFSPGDAPMASWEKAYQPQGHARWVDCARLFGWDGLGAYWYSYLLDEENGTLPASPTSTDNLLLRLCRSTGEDIRPLFHFWGIHPQDPVALEAAVAAEGLTPAPEIYNLLTHYKTLLPADNAAYQAWCLYWYGRPPSINGYGVEREHTRQWDTTDYFTANGWTEQRPNGEIYTEDSAADIEARVQELIDLYFTDYTAWAANWPGAELGDPDADLDGDGLDNEEERIWGLDPTSASSLNPITVPLDSAGTFSYTRRDAALSGLTYSVWTSPDLQAWTEDPGAGQVPGTPDANGVETVAVTISPALLTAPPLFVRVSAAE